MKELMRLNGMVLNSKMCMVGDTDLVATAEIEGVRGVSMFEQSADDPINNSGMRLHFKSDIKPGTKIACVIYEVNDDDKT